MKAMKKNHPNKDRENAGCKSKNLAFPKNRVQESSEAARSLLAALPSDAEEQPSVFAGPGSMSPSRAALKYSVHGARSEDTCQIRGVGGFRDPNASRLHKIISVGLEKSLDQTRAREGQQMDRHSSRFPMSKSSQRNLKVFPFSDTPRALTPEKTSTVMARPEAQSQATCSSETESISGGWTTPAGPTPAVMSTRQVGAQGDSDRPATPTHSMVVARSPSASTQSGMSRSRSRVQTVRPGSGARSTAPFAGNGYARKGTTGRRNKKAAKSADSDHKVRTDAAAKMAWARSLVHPETGTPKGRTARRTISACPGGVPCPNPSATMPCRNLEAATGSRSTTPSRILIRMPLAGR